MIRIPVGALGKFPPPNEIFLLTAPSGFEFYPAGSHYFGVATEDSDFDFITKYSEAVVDYLESKDFILLGSTPETEEEYEATDTHGVYELGRIQVQVVYDLDATLKARDILRTYFNQEHKRLNKEARAEVWPATIKLVQLINSLSKEKS